MQTLGASCVSCVCLLHELAQTVRESIDLFGLRIAIARSSNRSSRAEALQQGQCRKVARSDGDTACIEMPHDVQRRMSGNRERKHGQAMLWLPRAKQTQPGDIGEAAQRMTRDPCLMFLDGTAADRLDVANGGRETDWPGNVRRARAELARAGFERAAAYVDLVRHVRPGLVRAHSLEQRRARPQH